MPGIDTDIICHWLAIDSKVKPVKQKLRKINKERSQALSDEVDRLLQASFIQETFFLDWLTNTVLVKKKGGKLRVCIDFTNLNKVALKTATHF